LTKGEEYIIIAGAKEKLATKVNRVSPPRLYKLIRESKVK
ncbi:MAG: oxidoreductase, partial [Psychrobacter alimentarius]